MNAEDVIKEKESIIQLMESLQDQLLEMTMTYKGLQSELWLNTDWADAVGKAKPTVDEKKAYITLHSFDEKERKDYLYNKIQILKLKLELCDDKMKCCNNE